MSILSNLIETTCFFSFWTETRYQKLNSSFVIKFMTLLILSMTGAKITNGQEIPRMATEDFHSSTPSLIKFHPPSDSLFNDRRAKENQSLNAQFEQERKENNTRIKDQNIRLLEQQAKIEHANLKQATLKQSITTACAAFLIIVVGLVYVHYHQKQKDNGIITEQNKELQRLIEEKEWLVKEIHHRVTNNLHIVISLLESQAMFLRDDALKAIKISQHRIYAMLLIHQKLYRSDDIKTIDMKIYLAELIQYLENGFTIKRKINIALHAETLKLDVSQAIPFALIINEALTNAIKHAFPGTRIGNIVITLARRGEAAMVEIEDNGIGMPADIKTSGLNTLGMQLMTGLSKDIDAKFNIYSEKGTRVTVIFNVKIKSTSSNSIHKKRYLNSYES
jgi:two-component system, sensor histidine kinase PdtaS